MLDTKLILVEGLPGSGKSTTAQYIALQVKENGLPTRWFHEAEKPHPIRDWDVLLQDGIAEYISFSIKKWQSFVENAEDSNEITVFDAMLFQCMVEVLLRWDFPRNRIMDIVLQIQEIITRLDPVLVYLRHDDIAQATMKLRDLRGETNERKHIEWFENSRFAKVRGMRGPNGMAEFRQVYQDLTDNLFNRLEIKKLAIENSAGDWKQYYHQILGFLSLQRMDTKLPEGYLNKFVGTFIGEEAQQKCVIEMEDGQLMVSISIMFKSHLIPIGENRFYAAGAPIELHFQEDGSTVICSMEHRVLLEWDLEGKILIKVE